MINACDSLISTVPGHLAAPSALPVHTVGDPKTRVLTRAINFMPLVYLKTMDIRFSSPPLEELQSPTEITITGRNYETYNFNQSSFNDCIRKLEALTRFPLRPGQVEALQSLAEGKDVVLVAKTGYGKTLIFTGYNFLIPPTIEAITLIISPLVAIEQDQAEELKNRFGPYATPVVLDGKAELRAEIARGKYTHVWASAEVVLADLVDNNKKSGTVRRSCVKRFSSGYIDQGSFHSVAQDEVFRRRLQLLAIDELHLCASTSWGGSFRIVRKGLELLIVSPCRSHHRLVPGLDRGHLAYTCRTADTSIAHLPPPPLSPCTHAQRLP